MRGEPPSPEGDGFAGSYTANLLAERPEARSGPEIESPVMHDHRCRNIPVEISTAVTAVSMLGQRLGGELAARWALLTGIPWVDLDDLTTSVCSFGVEHQDQLRPRGVMSVLCQHAAGEALDIEILDRNPAEAIDERAADLVQVIAPLVGNVRLILGERGLAPGTPFGGGCAAGEASLAPSQAVLCLPRQSRPFDRLAVGDGRNSDETQVDADRCSARMRGGRRNRDVEDHGPLAILAGEDRARGLAWKLAVSPDLDLAGHADDSDTHLNVLADRLERREPPAFWSIFAAIDGAYDKRSAAP